MLHLGPLGLPKYTLLLDAGLLSGTLLVCGRARRQGVRLARALDAVLAAALGGLAGARAGYVATHWAYYADHLGQAVLPWRGGLTWQTGLVGGLVAIAIHSAVTHSSLRDTVDLLAPGVATLVPWAWLACLAANRAFGRETYPGQGLFWTLSLELPDLYGIRAPRIPVQLLGAAWATIAWALTLAAGRHERLAGLAFPLWLALHAAGTFTLGFGRGDEVTLLAGWRADQVADLVLAVAAMITLTSGLGRRDPARRQRL